MFIIIMHCLLFYESDVHLGFFFRRTTYPSNNILWSWREIKVSSISVVAEEREMDLTKQYDKHIYTHNTLTSKNVVLNIKCDTRSKQKKS